MGFAFLCHSAPAAPHCLLLFLFFLQKYQFSRFSSGLIEASFYHWIFADFFKNFSSSSLVVMNLLASFRLYFHFYYIRQTPRARVYGRCLTGWRCVLSVFWLVVISWRVLNSLCRPHYRHVGKCCLRLSFRLEFLLVWWSRGVFWAPSYPAYFTGTHFVCEKLDLWCVFKRLTRSCRRLRCSVRVRSTSLRRFYFDSLSTRQRQPSIPAQIRFPADNSFDLWKLLAKKSDDRAAKIAVRSWCTAVSWSH